MRKLGLALLVVVPLGLYLWLGGDKSSVSEHPGVAVTPRSPPPAARPYIPLSRDHLVDRRQGPAPTDSPLPREAASGYRGPAYAEGEVRDGYPATPDSFNFRPWTENEKLRLEREQSNPYTEIPMAPGRGYALYPPKSYAQQPRYAPPMPGDIQFRFRPQDPGQEQNRWTGNFPPPNYYQPNDLPQQGELYPYLGRETGNPWQKNSGAVPARKSLWAARGLEL